MAQFARPDLVSDFDDSLRKTVRQLQVFLVGYARVCAYIASLNWASMEKHHAYQSNLAPSRGIAANWPFAIDDLPDD